MNYLRGGGIASKGVFETSAPADGYPMYLLIPDWKYEPETDEEPMDLSQIAGRLVAEPTLSPLDRAEAAANRASRWHQGSGIQADMYAGMCEQCMEAAQDPANAAQASLYQQAAFSWADAAEADADYLDKTHGDWDDSEDWKAAVGPAIMKAAQASKALGMDTSELELD